METTLRFNDEELAAIDVFRNMFGEGFKDADKALSQLENKDPDGSTYGNPALEPQRTVAPHSINFLPGKTKWLFAHLGGIKKLCKAALENNALIDVFRKLFSRGLKNSDKASIQIENKDKNKDLDGSTYYMAALELYRTVVPYRIHFLPDRMKELFIYLEVINRLCEKALTYNDLNAEMLNFCGARIGTGYSYPGESYSSDNEFVLKEDHITARKAFRRALKLTPEDSDIKENLFHAERNIREQVVVDEDVLDSIIEEMVLVSA